MLSDLTNQFFWFTQPSSFISQIDRDFGYLSLGLVIIALIFRILTWRSKNEVNRKIFLKFWHLGLTIGALGLVWYFFRFENAPILSVRAWLGLVFIIGLIWLFFILKFLVIDYRTLKTEHEREVQKNKYLPKSR